MATNEHRTADLEPVYVLHRRPYRESSLLLECLSASHGRLGLVALGARRPKSPWRGLLEPFQPLLIRWSGQGELRSLRAAETSGRSLRIPGRALAAGFYLSELVMRLLPRDDPAPELFLAYGTALRSLADGGQGGWVLRLFEKRALTALGYGFDLAATRDAVKVEPEQWYRYADALGLVACSPSDLGAAPGWALWALETEASPSGLPGDPARSVLPVMREALRPVIGDRPLSSRSLLRRPRQGNSVGGSEPPTLVKPDQPVLDHD